MKQDQLKHNPNRLVQFLQKPMCEFTKADILKVIEEFEIEMIKFRYMANDGRLKTLNFVINSMEHADEILTSGERVDGSSLFPFLEAGSSDLYVIPRFRTAFIDPFADIPTLPLQLLHQRRRTFRHGSRIHPRQSRQRIPQNHRRHGIRSHGRTRILRHRPQGRPVSHRRPTRLPRLFPFLQI